MTSAWQVGAPVAAAAPGLALAACTWGGRALPPPPPQIFGRAAASLTDAQVTSITAYLRARYTDKPAWSNLDQAVAKARKEGAS